MNARLLAAAALTVLFASTAEAQANTCPPGSTNSLGIPDRQRATQDACQMGVDIYQLMAPQLGLSLTGGNATLGQGGTLGGLGHFVIEARGNVLTGDIPDINNFPTPSYQGRQVRQLPSKTQLLGLPTADAAVGLFKGLPLGLTNILGIDALVSATYVPTVTANNFSIKPSENLKFGYGARIGLLQESLVVPGVSVTYLKRDLPSTNLSGTAPQFGVNITSMSVNTTAWRLVASKSLVLFGVAAGVGQDKYDQSATVQASVNNTPIGNVQSDQILMSQSMTRTNLFADVYLNFIIGKIVAEVGQVSGGSAPTYNTFSGGDAAKSRPYGSVGLRFGF